MDAMKAGRAYVAGFIGDLRKRPGPRDANVASIESGVGLSNATMQQRLTAIRLFFDYLIEEGHRETNPVGRGRYIAGKGFGIGKRHAGFSPSPQKAPMDPERRGMATAARRGARRNDPQPLHARIGVRRRARSRGAVRSSPRTWG